MAVEQATFTFYRISKAGFYRAGSADPAFSNTSEMLTELKNWAAPKTLKQTKTFEANEDRYPSYLVDTKNNVDDWVLLLWNEVPSNGQRMPSLSENARFGEGPEVIMNPIQDGSIPGYATYFWFMPNSGLMATVRLHNKLTAQSSLQQYLQCFLKQSSKHVRSELVELDDGSHEVKITGYMLNPDDDNEDRKHYYPRFSTHLVKNPGKHDEIRQRANNVKKIERVLELDLAQPEDLGLWQKMLDWVNLGQQEGAGISTKVRYTISPDVNLKDINDMIDDWDADESEVNDYGFVFEGDPNKIFWLSNSLARTQFELDLIRENDEFVQSQSLLDELIRKKNLIIGGAGLL
ncbi:hypothetical protein ACUH7A_004022 [Yersinia enterocolitica]